MSRRIDIELTSALDDGSFTWRAAGARQPKGVIPGSLLPDDAQVGNQLKIEVEQELDGIQVLGVVAERHKSERDDLLELISDDDFQPVVETRAKRDRSERRGRRDDDRRGRRDRRRGEGRGRDDRGGDGRGRDDHGRGGRGRDGGERRRNRGGEGRGRRGPSFTPPPEVPQRPKPKRLKPGKQHRTAVLDEIPAEQRPIAELALQGMNAVRQRVREENQRAKSDGRAEMPEARVVAMAEQLLPKLRVAEWRDRAEAALRQLDRLDLRDLRSVVAAAGDPIVARDESTTELAAELRTALAHKQEEELQLWFGDVDAALAVGRVIRALRLSSQPPKAGVPFPADIAQRLVDSTVASLAPMDSPERWAAMLEALAFSPIRSQVVPTHRPDIVNDELVETVKRLAPALPQIAALFEIEVDPNAPMPKPHRQGPRQRKARAEHGRSDRPERRKQDDRSRRHERTAADDAHSSSTPDPSDGPAAPDPTEPAPDAEAADGSTAPADEAAPPAAEEPTTDTGDDQPGSSDDPAPEPVDTDAPNPPADAAEAPTTDTGDDQPESSDDPAPEPVDTDAPNPPADAAEAPTTDTAERVDDD